MEVVLAGGRIGLNDALDAFQEGLDALLEKEKKRFAGTELMGKTLGVVGLGNIGSLVANMGLALGMKVIGYDPAISVEAAWRLSSQVKRADAIASLFSRCDYISLHLPVLDSTRGLVNSELLGAVQPGTCLLNFARQEIVDESALVEAVTAFRLAADRRFAEVSSRAAELLAEHRREIQAKDMDYGALRAKMKREIAKKRGFIL